jgi:hypothetical protein
VPDKGLGGWPYGGVYKWWWPSVLATLLQCLVSHVKIVGVQGTIEREWGPLRG